MGPFRLDLAAAAVLGFLGMVAIADVAPAQTPTLREKPRTVGGQPDALVARRTAVDPARILARQMRLEKTGDMTGLLSRGFKAAYNAVPRDEDNLGVTILGGGYDVPDKVVRVSDPRYDDASDPRKASATATLHYTNPDAPVPSFDRSITIAFVREDDRWTIDDVRMIGPEGRPTGREVGLKSAFESLRRPKADLRQNGRP